MSTSVLVPPRPLARSEDGEGPATSQLDLRLAAHASGRRPRLVAALVAGGIVAAGTAAVGLAATARDLRLPSSGVAHVIERTPAPSVDVPAVEDISVVSEVYEPGQESGWHVHSGIHAVAVLSGTLTVYDRQCQRHTFDAAHPYVGGQELHLARNETNEPLAMVVTYISSAGPADSTRRPGAPDCWGASNG